MDPARSRATEDESSNYMMSVSDIMSALLFVFIITLMAFVLNFQQAHSELEDTLGRYTGLEDLREQMLKEIEQELEDMIEAGAFADAGADPTPPA